MISIVVSSNRPMLWEKFEETFYSNFVNQIIFVGPNKPKKKINNKSIFIKSFYKPVQCLAQGISVISNNYFFFAPDDISCSKNTIDKFITQSIENLSKKIILVPNFYMGNKNFTNGLKFNENDYYHIPVFSLLTKKIYFEIGGFDKNFIAVLYDIDFYNRLFYIYGFESKIINYFNISENSQSIFNGNLSKDYWIQDRALLNNLWSKINNKNYIRNKKIDEFDYSIINIRSQGRTSLKWSGKNNLFLLINSFFLVKLLKSLKNILRDKLYYIKQVLINE